MYRFLDKKVAGVILPKQLDIQPIFRISHRCGSQIPIMNINMLEAFQNDYKLYRRNS